MIKIKVLSVGFNVLTFAQFWFLDSQSVSVLGLFYLIWIGFPTQISFLGIPDFSVFVFNCDLICIWLCCYSSVSVWTRFHVIGFDCLFRDSFIIDGSDEDWVSFLQILKHCFKIMGWLLANLVLNLDGMAVLIDWNDILASHLVFG